MKANFYYIVHIQYLGYRFHGWAKQPNVKTVHYMIDRTLTFVMGQQWFKTLGASRTDAMVSANHAAFELFLKEPIEDISEFTALFNKNLPPDIKVLKIEETDRHFNIINTPKQKEYIYLFSFGLKAHPFSSPFISTFLDKLDLELMKQGAKVFEGNHDFRAYTKKPAQEKVTTRLIEKSEIVRNEYHQASFFPSPSYAYVVQGKGFMRNQIRMMMGQLIRLGRNEIDLDYLESSLKTGFPDHLSLVAPASGLVLNQVEFQEG
ncbi:MAG: tRNA pseudouridine(38-40) synthase TruA [Roseivirga sp. XM-24bin3]|nr:MAG: tRNA pseudouridine(38-40) synthase TruA [Roseivirga sp. XM-24bin3]